MTDGARRHSSFVNFDKNKNDDTFDACDMTCYFNVIEKCEHRSNCDFVDRSVSGLELFDWNFVLSTYVQCDCG